MAETRAERRVVTALFVDVVGSTAMTIALGPERLKRALDRAFGELTAIIAAEVVTNLGIALAYFLIPLALWRFLRGVEVLPFRSVLVMFVIAQAFTSTGLAQRFACWLLAKAGGSTRRALLLFMVGTATLSTVVSDVPCAAVFMAVALGLFAAVIHVPIVERPAPRFAPALA